MIRKFIVLFLCCAATSLFLGCIGAKPVVQYTTLNPQNYASLPEMKNVEIINGEPDKPYSLLGDVMAKGGWYWWAGMSSPPEEVMDFLRTKVKAVGGQAVINFKSWTAPPGTEWSGTFTAQGQVIRWK